MTEQEYDEIVAPMMADIANKVNDLGGNFVGRVEWEPGEAAITAKGNMKAAGIAQYLTYVAAMSRGNIDAMLLALIRDKDVSQSIFLHSHNKHQEPSHDH